MAERCDIFISGGGVAGLTAAAAFGSAGFRTICVDPAPPVTERDAEGADLRTTAFLQPARRLLERAGLWERLAPHATPLGAMRIVDASGGASQARILRDFDAREISEGPFGWNLPNWLLRREIAARLEDLPEVDFRPGTGFAGLLTREGEARVSLSEGGPVSARLAIAADGRNSPMREAAGIGVRRFRYGQKALTFSVTHARPHEEISTEVHRSGGPFTLVPMPDHEGRPCSAVVWMVPGPEAQRLMALPERQFAAEATRRSAELHGELTLASKRMVWPITAQIAHRMSAERVALIAEAAHVVPPIGAQGLNMSLADIATLLDLAQEHPETLGDRRMLDAYHRRRHPEVNLRVRGIDALNRASMAGTPVLQDLRAAGIGLLHDAAPLRRALMRLGLGATD